MPFDFMLTLCVCPGLGVCGRVCLNNAGLLEKPLPAMGALVPRQSLTLTPANKGRVYGPGETLYMSMSILICMAPKSVKSLRGARDRIICFEIGRSSVSS